MPAIFSKNCVLFGEVDFYCLVCCKHLLADYDVLDHIQEPKHKHNLSSHTYSNKLKQDGIRKVAGVYFCELCNITFPTTAKVDVHITEDTHVQRKTKQLLRRENKRIIFQDKILITENAWNGLVDNNTCVLCNVEFENDAVHRSEQKHILNLISSKVMVSCNSDIYRQVDDTYQCLTCNKVVSTNIFKKHLESAQHKDLLTKCDRNQTDISDNKDQVAHLKKITADKNAQGGHSKKTVNTILDSNSKMKAKVQSTKLTISELNDIINQRQFFIDTVNNFFTEKCCTNILVNLLMIEKNTTACGRGEKQVKLSNVKRESSKYRIKMALEEFVETGEFFILKPFLYPPSLEIPFVIINERYILNVAILIGLARRGDKIVCRICPKDLTPENWKLHITSSQHKDIFKSSSVIISVENEFVIQLKPNLYSCNCCAHLEPNWEDMLEHFNTEGHETNKKRHEKLFLRHNLDKTWSVFE